MQQQLKYKMTVTVHKEGERWFNTMQQDTGEITEKYLVYKREIYVTKLGLLVIKLKGRVRKVVDFLNYRCLSFFYKIINT